MLLADLLRALPADLPVTATVDARMSVPQGLPPHVHIERVQPSFLGRFLAEVQLCRRATDEDQVLCFGNLPPLFRVRGDVSVFLQNRYLVDSQAPLDALPIKLRLRLLVERVWLARCRGRARRYFVQTDSMRRLAEAWLHLPVECAPFVPEAVRCQVGQRTDSQSQRFDFIYVASGEAHKNHLALIRAWGMLADEGLFPSLALTLAAEAESHLLPCIMAESAKRELRIHNLGSLPYDQLIAVYQQSDALIYPSSFESFGLPLVEARLAGISVLAPELDYVRDITDPEETFDPCSPVSIARAVKRYLQGRQQTVEAPGADAFLARLMNGADE